MGLKDLYSRAYELNSRLALVPWNQLFRHWNNFGPQKIGVFYEELKNGGGIIVSQDDAQSSFNLQILPGHVTSLKYILNPVTKFGQIHLGDFSWCFYEENVGILRAYRFLMQNTDIACWYYTGFPKDLGPSRVIHFTSERDFVELLHHGHPVVVAFTIKSNLTKRLDKVLEEAAAEFYPHIKFMRVECPKYPGFCITRQKTEYPFIEIFHNPEQAANQGRVVDPNTTKYSVKVLPFNYDLSGYGFREFFKRHGIPSSDPK